MLIPPPTIHSKWIIKALLIAPNRNRSNCVAIVRTPLKPLTYGIGIGIGIGIWNTRLPTKYIANNLSDQKWPQLNNVKWK